MTYPGALALTGVALLFAAAVLAVAADKVYNQPEKRLSWIAFAASLASLAGSAWWEALR